jgi:hypothetical protein
VAKAFKRVHLEHKDAIITCFKNISLFLLINSSENHLLKVRVTVTAVLTRAHGSLTTRHLIYGPLAGQVTIVTVPNLTRSESTSIDSTRLGLRSVTGLIDSYVTCKGIYIARSPSTLLVP